MFLSDLRTDLPIYENNQRFGPAEGAILFTEIEYHDQDIFLVSWYPRNSLKYFILSAWLGRIYKDQFYTG